MNDPAADLDSSNRLAASVLGVLLLLAGGYGLARGLGAFGADSRTAPLLGDGLRADLVRYAGWAGGLATLAALVVSWLGWRWLRRQLVPSSSLRRVVMGDGQGGRTTVDAGALTEAVTRDLLTSDHVDAGSGRAVGLEGTPRLVLTAEVAVGADPQAIRAHVADHVLPRAQAALGRHDLSAHLHLQLADPGARTLE